MKYLINCVLWLFFMTIVGCGSKADTMDSTVLEGNVKTEMESLTVFSVEDTLADEELFNAVNLIYQPDKQIIDIYEYNENYIAVTDGTFYIYRREFEPGNETACHVVFMCEKESLQRMLLIGPTEDYLVDQICVSGSCIYLLGHHVDQSIEMSDDSLLYEIFVYNQSGKLLFQSDIYELLDMEYMEGEYISGFSNRDGSLWLILPLHGYLCRVSQDGDCLSKVKLNGNGRLLASYKASTLAALSISGDRVHLSELNYETGDSRYWEVNSISRLTGAFTSERYGMYLMTERGLYAFVPERNAIIELVRFSKYGIDYLEILDIQDDSEGRIQITLRDETLQQMEVYDLKPINVGKIDLVEKNEKQIRVACLQSSELLRYAVNGFNASQNEVTAEIFEYYDPYQNDTSIEDALIRMNNDILNGTCGDVICLDGIKDADLKKKYAEVGAFQNLYELMNNDQGFRFDDYFEKVFQVNEMNGALYYLTPFFSVNTKYGAYSDVGNQVHLDEAILFDTDDPKTLFGKSYSKNELIHDLCIFTLGDVNNSEAVIFNKDQMAKYIELILGFPDAVSEEENFLVFMGHEDVCDVHMGRQRFYKWSLPNDDPAGHLSRTFSPLRQASIIYSPIEESYSCDGRIKEFFTGIGVKVGFCGFPVKRGCGSAIIDLFSLALPANGATSDIGWKFLMYTLTEQFQAGEVQYRKTTIPVRREVLEKDLDQYIAYDGDSDDPDYGITYTIIDPTSGEELEFPYPAVQPWMKEAFFDLMEQITLLDETDPEIEKIIMEEVGRCSRGECTVEQAAEAVVERVQLYALE